MNEAASSDKVHILHVEDNPGDIYITRRALKNASVPNQLQNIADGEEAKDYLASCVKCTNPRPDLILLDINLPTIDGLELLKWMMDQQDLRTIPVIVLSSSKSSRDIEKMQQHGAKLYLTKPDDVDEYDDIIVTIENFCRTINHRSGGENARPQCS